MRSGEVICGQALRIKISKTILSRSFRSPEVKDCKKEPYLKYITENIERSDVRPQIRPINASFPKRESF